MSKEKLYTVSLTLPDGKRKYYRAKTQKEAEEKREADKILLGRGVNIGDKTKFNAFAETWFNLYKKGKMHTRSEETIRGILDRHILPVIGDYYLRDLKPIHIQMLMNSVADMSHSTQKKVLQNTRAILSVAVDNGIIEKNPATASIKAGGSQPEEVVPLTQDQCKALLESLQGTRAYLLVLLLLESGLRIGEALGLMWSDIDYIKGQLHVERSIVYSKTHLEGVINTELKTSHAKRDVWIPWDLVDELKKANAKSKSLYVFSMKNGKYLSQSSFRSLWKIIDYRTIGKEDPDKYSLVERTLNFSVHPHQLRHTCITRWFEAGLDIKEIQRLAGHASPDITLRIYTHYQEKVRAQETAAKIQGIRRQA